MNELSNFDIDEILNHEDIEYNGIFSKDVLPNPLKKGFYIINLADDSEGGSHWTALYKYNDGLYIYYDSFGFICPKDVEERMKHGNLIFSNRQIQDINQTSCGYYSIAFIKYMTKNKHKNPIDTFNKFVLLFKNNPKVNELVLHDILYR
jgi:hypothetical protein